MIVLLSGGRGKGGRGVGSGGGGMKEVVRGGGIETEGGMMEVGGGKRGRVGGREMGVREGEVVEGDRSKRQQMSKLFKPRDGL